MPPELDTDPDSEIRPEDVVEALLAVNDPELGVNLVDLGLIYRIQTRGDRVDVNMTLTALGCPAADWLVEQVHEVLLSVPGARSAGVLLVYDPPWSPERLSEDARFELGLI